jgi:LmbE family N-acetylglucosaminyl deacetylase
MKIATRKFSLRVAEAALRVRSRRYGFEGEPRCLVFSPHQDDSSLGCGGLILRKRLDASPVDIAYITDGGASHPGHPIITPDTLARQRRAEALDAAGILGVDRAQTHFLEAGDGTLDRLEPAVAEDLVKRIAALLDRIRPDEIFLPCRRDGSSEHNAAFALVRRGLDRSGLSPRIFEYPIWARWMPGRLIRPFLASRRVWRVDFAGYEPVKSRALSAYRSQIEPTPPWRHAVLSPEFISFFSSPEEFFFENRLR